MKFDTPIEVSGIKRIVIDQKYLWSHEGWLNFEKPPQRVGETMWHIPDKDGIQHIKSDMAMFKYIRVLLRNPELRGWIHGDTLNITK